VAAVLGVDAASTAMNPSGHALFPPQRGRGTARNAVEGAAPVQDKSSDAAAPSTIRMVLLARCAGAARGRV
jgi:hypothetical protein